MISGGNGIIFYINYYYDYYVDTIGICLWLIQYTCSLTTFNFLYFVYCRRVARNEVYAHAVLGKHSHVVRYYSAWAENGHLYIQNEYCNGGSLAEEIAMHQKRGTRFTEAELKDILKQVAHGLKYIHAQQLAHMDIKPGKD